jgi:hypothetical protein
VVEEGFTLDRGTDVLLGANSDAPFVLPTPTAATAA